MRPPAKKNARLLFNVPEDDSSSHIWVVRVDGSGHTDTRACAAMTAPWPGPTRKSMNSRAAFGCGALAMTAEGDTTITAPSCGMTVTIGLPRDAVTVARPSGPIATQRSPEFSVVTESFTLRPICGLPFSSCSKNDQP